MGSAPSDFQVWFHMPSSPPTVGAQLSYGAAVLAAPEPAPLTEEEAQMALRGRVEYGGGVLTVATNAKPKLKGPVNIQAPATAR